MKSSFGISNFLEEISSLSHSVVFLYFFALISEEGFLISPNYSLELCIQMGISFLFSFAFCFSSFHSCLKGLLRQPFCFFAFLFHGDGLDPCLLYISLYLTVFACLLFPCPIRCAEETGWGRNRCWGWLGGSRVMGKGQGPEGNPWIISSCY